MLEDTNSLDAAHIMSARTKMMFTCTSFGYTAGKKLSMIQPPTEDTAHKRTLEKVLSHRCDATVNAHDASIGLTENL